MQASITSATAGVSCLGIGADIEYKSKQEALSSRQETEVYLLAAYNVAKVELSIQKKFIKASPELEEEIREAVKNQNIGSYKKLIDIFTEYGFCIPTQFVLGGQIYCEDTKKVTSTDEAENAEQSFAISVEASFQGGSFSGGFGNATAKYTQNQQAQVRHQITKLVTGGEISLSNDPVRWIGSLGTTKTWRVIKRAGFEPLIDFLSPSLRTDCISLIKIFYRGASENITLAAMKAAYSTIMRPQEFYSPLLSAWFGGALSIRVQVYDYQLIMEDTLGDASLVPAHALHQWFLAREEHYLKYIERIKDRERSPLSNFLLGAGSATVAKSYNNTLNSLKQSGTLLLVKGEMERHQAVMGTPHPMWDQYAPIWKALSTYSTN